MDKSRKKDHPGRPGAEEKHKPCLDSEIWAGSYQGPGRSNEQWYLALQGKSRLMCSMFKF